MKKQFFRSIVTVSCILALASGCALTSDSALTSGSKAAKLSPDEAIAMLKAGNERFVTGKAIHPNSDDDRLALSGEVDQGDYAYATIIGCSDSRVPVEILFDAGFMDIFSIRVAGNVLDVDEVGSVEYGLAHVNTPVFVVLGHTQCGAVTTVTAVVQGEKIPLERNIVPLVDNVIPAVKKAIADNPNAHGADVVPYAIEENVWQGIEDLFMTSAYTRDHVNAGKAKVIGAIYDVSNGTIKWLPEGKTTEILKKVEANPGRAMEAMAK